MSDSTESQVKTGWRLTLIEWALITGAVVLIAHFVGIALLQARDAARISQSKNNLRGFALALNNYHDTMNVLPPGGVFNAAGVPYHCWTTSIDPYLEASPWYSKVDFSVPWDDPTQIDHFMGRRGVLWANPRVVVRPRLDGLAEPFYAGNSWLLHRNSSVSLKELGGLQNTLLVGEVSGDNLPLGCPGNWRDVGGGLNRSESAFGIRKGQATQIVLADGHVQKLGPETDPDIWNTFRGPAELAPTHDRVQRPQRPYRLQNTARWRKGTVLTGHKMLGIHLKLTPDGHVLYVNFDQEQFDRKSPVFKESGDKYGLQDFDKYGGIQHVLITGDPQANDLAPFAELKHLKRLTLSTAKVEGDVSAFRSRLNVSVQVD